MTRIDTICLQCKQAFGAPLKELNRGNARFCSRTCGALYANGQRPRSTTAKGLRRIARELWMRRNGGAQPLCRICCRKADIHHIDGNPSNNLPENHDRLCKSHHTSWHNFWRGHHRLKASESGYSDARCDSSPYPPIFVIEYFKWVRVVSTGQQELVVGDR